MKNIFITVSPWSNLIGRILLALIFILSGYDKIGGYATTQEYMSAFGVPGALLPLVIAVELGGGILIVLGLLTRYVALALAGFSLLAGFMFHSDGSDPMQQIMLLKNIAIAGGFLILVANGAGKMSLDRRLGWLSVEETQ